MNIKTSSLAFCEGSSDKEYHLSLEKCGNKYDVLAAWGRRGSTLQTGAKVSGVTLEEAEKVYDKVIKEKVGKGYMPMLDGKSNGISSSVTNAVTDKDQRDTGLRPQLLNPITEEEAEAYLTDDDWCAQEKFDGKRMTIKKDTSEVIAANKKGLSIGFPDKIASAFSALSLNCVVDGESISETLYAFDLLQCDKEDLRQKNYASRLGRLLDIIPDNPNIVLAKTAIGTKEKRDLMAELKKKGKEGIVFKKLSAKWYAGRPASGSSAVKCKFWASASCVVSKVNAKRSIEVSLEGQPVGNVTIPPNKNIPAVGQVVEIKYLYVAGKGGSLYQPIYLNVRDDVDVYECTFKAQKLKYKSQDED
jgi:bifunctional non-homologous end joining protein LigD